MRSSGAHHPSRRQAGQISSRATDARSARHSAWPRSPAADAATALSPGSGEAQLNRPGDGRGDHRIHVAEQARGDDIAARSDLFTWRPSLRNVHRPAGIQGQGTVRVIFQQILSDAGGATRLNPALPFKVDDFILKGLEKDRACATRRRQNCRRSEAAQSDASAGKLTSTMPAAGTAARPISSGSVSPRRSNGARGLVLQRHSVHGHHHRRHLWRLCRRHSRLGFDDRTSRDRDLDVTRVTTSGQATDRGPSPGRKDRRLLRTSRTNCLPCRSRRTPRCPSPQPGTTVFSPDGATWYSSRARRQPYCVLLAIPVLAVSLDESSQTSRRPGLSPDGKQMAFPSCATSRKRSASG